MIIWIRNLVIILLVLSVIYTLLSISSRMRQKRKLISEYKVTQAETPEEEFVAKGMQKYERSLKPKLIFGVFLVPLAISALLIYLAQYS